MNENSEKIKRSQLMFLIVGYIIGSVLLISLIDITMKQDTWLVILFGYLASIPFVISYFQLAKKFPGKTLIEINDMVYGKILGKIISVCYVIFFLLLFSLNSREIVDFYSAYIIPETPPAILYVLIALTCTYAVKKGISAIAKINMYFFVFSVFTLIFTFLLLIGNMDFLNFLPMFEAPANGFIYSTYVMMAIPYCEILLFLMVIPYVDSNKKLGRYIFGGVSISMLFLFVVVIRSIAVLGSSGVIFAEDAFDATRMINIGEVLTRLELLVALAITANMTIRISVVQFAAAKGISQLLKLRTYTPLLLPLAAIGIVIALALYKSAVEKTNFGNYYIVFATPFLFFIPPLSLLVSKIRKLPKTGENQQ